jgi:nucleoside-diphosphate-sugar epimerase
MPKKKALIVGALGVIGRNLLAHLEGRPEWDLVGVSRRRPDFETRAEFVSVDLLDRRAAERALSRLTDVTHVFYAAFQPRPTWAEHNAPNLAMLVNSVEPVAAVARGLEHVHLVEGTKIYGSHLGPFKTPAKESDPPHMPPNFYYDQEQWLREFRRGKRWTWSGLRPQTVCGFALGNPMNIATAIAVYAAVSKELALPLRFPGKPAAYRAIYQVTDSELLAEAMLWCATAGAARDEVFNVTNGDFFRWEHLWPRFAEFFGVPLGPVQTIPLAQFMADKGPVWERIVARHGLRPVPYDQLVAWPFADYVFGTEWDVMSDTVKIRQAGFHRCLSSERALLDLFGKFREMRVIP